MAAAVVGRWLSKGLPRVSLLRPSASAQVCLAGRWYSDELEFREPGKRPGYCVFWYTWYLLLTDSGQYRYTTTHEWASLKGNTATVGISIYAQVCWHPFCITIPILLSSSQEKLGDVVFAELPDLGQQLERNGSYYDSKVTMFNHCSSPSQRRWVYWRALRLLLISIPLCRAPWLRSTQNWRTPLS